MPPTFAAARNTYFRPLRGEELRRPPPDRTGRARLRVRVSRLRSPRRAGDARWRCPPGRDDPPRKSRVSASFMAAGTSLKPCRARRAQSRRAACTSASTISCTSDCEAKSPAAIPASAAALRRIAEQRLDFGWAEIARSIRTTSRPVLRSTPCSCASRAGPLDLHADARAGDFDELAHASVARRWRSRNRPAAACCSISHCTST